MSVIVAHLNPAVNGSSREYWLLAQATDSVSRMQKRNN